MTGVTPTGPTGPTGPSGPTSPKSPEFGSEECGYWVIGTSFATILFILYYKRIIDKRTTACSVTPLGGTARWWQLPWCWFWTIVVILIPIVLFFIIVLCVVKCFKIKPSSTSSIGVRTEPASSTSTATMLT